MLKKFGSKRTVHFFYMTEIINPNKIVLFAKQPGKTSFSSLFTIKHGFNTTKVGHTGTLDSFASGLLVVCVGSLTRLAGRITEFDKTYQAVIKFGQETDTLECTGNIVRSSGLPTEEKLKAAVEAHRGILMQVPPAFSAIHLDGKRASDLARCGQDAVIPPRKITVFSSEILEIKKNEENLVEAARIEFSVSKGTYIRALARDIANHCGSSGHLVGLLRTKVGNFHLEDAAGYDFLEKFTIESAIVTANKTRKLEKEIEERKKNGIHEKKVVSDDELQLQQECIKKSVSMTKELADFCGFGCLTLKESRIHAFDNGQKLHTDMFTSSPFDIKEKFAAVFLEDSTFKGLLEKNDQGYFGYCFVIH